MWYGKPFVCLIDSLYFKRHEEDSLWRLLERERPKVEDFPPLVHNYATLFAHLVMLIQGSANLRDKKEPFLPLCLLIMMFPELQNLLELYTIATSFAFPVSGGDIKHKMSNCY